MDPRELGRRGEEVAARHLRKNGWTILGTNVRVGPREVDIIARRDQVLAFIEVKTRRGEEFGGPMEAISWRKMQQVTRAAAGWLGAQAGVGAREIRFDAVGIVWPRDAPPRVQHIPNAWRIE